MHVLERGHLWFRDAQMIELHDGDMKLRQEWSLQDNALPCGMFFKILVRIVDIELAVAWLSPRRS